MRAFIGVDFDESTKDEIRTLQQYYRDRSPKGRWKHRDNFHITLKFLREVDLGQKEQIDTIMADICGRHAPFVLKFTQPQIFNGKDSIRVLWLGLDGDIDRLHSLQKEIDLALEPVGFQRESRKYNPHITMGQDIILEDSFETLKGLTPPTHFKPMQITNLYLFKSEQIENKRIYTKVSRYDLP